MSLLLGTVLLGGQVSAAPGTAARSTYGLAQQAPFNRPEFYPLSVRPDPSLYLPHGDWQGRLILPSVSDLGAQGAPEADWVWLEVELAPRGHRDLVGQRVRLAWQDTAEIRNLVRLVTTDIRLDEEARRALESGRVIPERLDGRRQVGPLQSLAGARPYDDVIVSLEQVRVDRQPGAVPTLRVGRPPIQTTGRYRGLVQVLGQDRDAGPDRFRVRHYDRRSGRFSGTIDSLRIPRQPLDRRGRRMFDPEGILNSPAGRQGWYVYGAPDAAGVFTVQALQPRALMRIQADRRLVGTDRGLDYLLHHQWERTPRLRGRIERVEILPDPLPDGADASRSPQWRVGDQALVLHLFGEVGGPLGDMAIIDHLLVPGHFSLGLARVVSDPFTGEPVFDIRYYQLYTQMSEGIVSGTIDWPAFAGNLQRGWVGLRPFSDVLVALPWLSDLQLGSLRLSPLRELAIQEEVLMARYRSGDGTGFTDLTVTQSCVQDSAQALYITLQNLRRRVMDDAALAAWLKAHPEAPESRRHDRLSRLAAAILDVLTWAGSVRPDWDHNAARMADPASFRSDGRQPFRRPQFMDLLSSRRVVMPRRAHEELSTLFLRNGSGLWVLRTNQIPGGDTTVEPMAPTSLDP